MCSTVLAPLIVNMTGEHAYGAILFVWPGYSMMSYLTITSASKPTSDFFWPSASAWTYAIEAHLPQCLRTR